VGRCSLEKGSSVQPGIGVVCNDKMSRRDKVGISWLGVFALTLAVLSMLFVTQAQTHSHANGHDEAACQICQAAHVGAAPAAQIVALSSPLIATDYVRPLLVTIHQELFPHDAPSRAPPAA